MISILFRIFIRPPLKWEDLFHFYVVAHAKSTCVNLIIVEHGTNHVKLARYLLVVVKTSSHITKYGILLFRCSYNYENKMISNVYCVDKFSDYYQFDRSLNNSKIYVS